MSDSKIYSHVLIGRVCGDYCIQVKACYYEEPPESDLNGVEDTLRDMYIKAFNEEPEQVAFAVLPYIEAEDGPAEPPEDRDFDDEDDYLDFDDED